MLYHTVGKMAGVGPNSLLLDVCCGTGTIGLTLAKQVGAAGLVVGSRVRGLSCFGSREW